MGLRNRRVLISGASVAGPVLAYWLRRYGFEPTVVELAPALRESGYPIDVRGDAVTVARRMGVLDRVRAAGLDTAGLSFVNKRGRISGSIDMRAIRKATASTDIELCRGDLVRILCDTNADDVEYRFGDRITALHQDEGGVQVEFANGAPREFDLVLGADGVHSGVRGLAFGPEQEFRHYLGCYFGGGEVDLRFGEQDRVLLRSAPDRALGVYRFRDRAVAFYLFRSKTLLEHDYRDPTAPRRIFAERFTDDFWPTGLVEAISGTDATDFDSLSQIRMPAWSSGRVALAGDAAHCPTLVTGAGTSLAMVGAYRLAGELHAAAGDHERAFAAHERHHRPQVTKAQSRTAQGMNMFMPPTEAAIWRRDQFLRLVPLSVLFARLTRRFARQAPELLDYPGGAPEPPDYSGGAPERTDYPGAVSAVPSPPPARLR
jgi:2-polyprenyl-6-methoxyphenol hydroxylase-like FAD-dependent oxidoreductase